MAHPRYSAAFEHLRFTGNTDGFILGHVDQMVQKQFFNIFGALTDPSRRELDNAILIKVATFILRCMTIVSFSDFVDASKDVNGEPLIGMKALKRFITAVKIMLWILGSQERTIMFLAGTTVQR